MVEEHIAQLVKELELPQKLPQEADGVWRIPLDDDSVIVTDLNPGVYLYTSLVDLPSGPQEELMVLLSTCNLFGQRTDGAVIGLEENGRRLSLSLAIAEDLDFDGFRNHLEDFINQKDFWSDKVRNWGEEPPG